MTEKDEVIRCVYTNEHILFLSFMQFVKDGGLFIRTKIEYELGDKVSLSLVFFDQPEPYLVEGRVIWVTPKGAQGNKPAGIGVQFTSDNKQQVTSLIEAYLAGKLKSTQSTDTM